MANPRARKVFVCGQCGKESPRWLGRCPDCGEWNSYSEMSREKPSHSQSQPQGQVVELPEVSAEAGARLATFCPEFDRVLGGGLVPGAMVLVSGDPGIGKSTLLLQVCSLVAGHGRKVLYVSGEESVHQVKLRADRLGVEGKGLFILGEISLDIILGRLDATSPEMVVIDSIQSVSLDGAGGAPGSMAQIRECTLRLMQWSKSRGVPLLVTGQVTKDGAIAGPKALEHIVDVVLYMEGDPLSAHRILRGVKNRFGSTNEVGVFEMRGQGLAEVSDPSGVFLSRRDAARIGSAVVPVLEGSRPLLVEIQALTSPTAFSLPRRTANGVDFNRLLVLLAVMSKRAGLHLTNQDVIVNVAGGLRISEPAADLAVALAIASSFREREVSGSLAAVGEVGLGGEVRSVAQIERRLAEAARNGFARCIVPAAGGTVGRVPGIEPVPVDSLRQALRAGLGPKSPVEEPEPD